MARAARLGSEERSSLELIHADQLLTGQRREILEKVAQIVRVFREKIVAAARGGRAGCTVLVSRSFAILGDRADIETEILYMLVGALRRGGYAFKINVRSDIYEFLVTWQTRADRDRLEKMRTELAALQLSAPPDEN